MNYVHGYSKREHERLIDQSNILEKLLHSDTVFQHESRILEAGCGIGAQTRILAMRSPGAKITSVDISEESLNKAKALIEKENISNVSFKKENIFNTSFKDETFYHVFVCFVLEHLEKPIQCLLELKRILKPKGTITLIEGDHGSCFWFPETKESLEVWNSLIKAQQQLGHDPLIGRQLYPLIKKTGLKIKDVSPRWVYADISDPKLLDGILNKIIVPMVESAKTQVLNSDIVSTNVWEKGIKDLSDIGKIKNGTFFYTWFKGLATKV